MVAERTRAINALTALLRTIDLGIDTRNALSHSQFKVIAGGRDRREHSVVRICRQEVIRLAKRIVAPDAELTDNHKALDAAVEGVAPELCELARTAHRSCQSAPGQPLRILANGSIVFDF
jgi:transposase